MRNQAITLAALMLLGLPLLLPAPALAQQTTANAPAGWKTERTNSGIVRYTPPDLNHGETYHVTVYPSATLGSASLEDWLLAQIDGDPVPPGTVTGPAKVQAGNDKVVAAVRVFNVDGKAVAAIYTAMSGDGKHVGLVRTVFSAQGKLFERYRTDTLAISNTVIAGLKQQAKGSGSGSAASAAVPQVPRNEIQPGGKIVPGVYEGTQIYVSTWGKGTREVHDRFRLYLYANGEYRLCDENDKEIPYATGEFTYDAMTGKIDITHKFDLKNSRIDPDTDFCFYGRDRQGKPYLYGENERGLGTIFTSGRYVGTTRRLSPETERIAQERAEAEAKRYKWVVAPGKGVPAGQVAGIWHHYKTAVYYGGSGIGTNVTDESYLLLKDGTVHKGLPVPPDQLDLTRSRRNEPKAWGRWRRQGEKLLVAWPDAPGRYAALPGSMALPGKTGQRLQGRWGTGSSTSTLMGGSYRLWGVTFSRDGRFTKDERGGSGNSTFAQSGGQPAINSTYDDEGSVTSASNDNFTVSTGKKRRPGSDRSGTYSIDGYTITLRYDNGQVARLPFFFGDRKQETLWFEGAQLALDKDTD